MWKTIFHMGENIAFCFSELLQQQKYLFKAREHNGFFAIFSCHRFLSKKSMKEAESPFVMENSFPFIIHPQKVPLECSNKKSLRGII